MSPPSSLDLSPRLDEIARAVTWASTELPAWVDPIQLDVGLTEALTNAIVHGALEVSSSLRKEGVDVYLGEVERRSVSPKAQDKPLSLLVSRATNYVDISLSWRGAACPAALRGQRGGFDPLAGSGLGTTLIYASFDEVAWAEDGYSVRLRLYQPTTATTENDL